MKPARVAVLGIAILSGGAAALMMNGGKSPAPPPPELPQSVRTSDVLVAGGDLSVGTRLKPTDLRWQPWPAETVAPGYIKKSDNAGALEQVAGSLVRGGFLAGEPIRREKLIKTDGSGIMSAILSPGMRAVAVTIDTKGATSAGGFILPNDRVDVLRTGRDDDASRASGSDVHISERILSNVRVLAIGQSTQERNGEKVVTGETATLEVTAGQAEAVTLAQRMGQLSLVLRSLADAEAVEEARLERDSGLTIVRYGVSKQALTR